MVRVEPSDEPRFTEPVDVAELGRKLEQSALDGLRLHVAIGFVLVLGFTFIEWRAGRRTFGLGIETVGVAALVTSTFWRRLAHHVRRLAFVVGGTLLAAGALLHFGPLLGTGVFVVLAVLSASFFYSGRGVVVFSTAFVALMLLTALASSRGWIVTIYQLPDPLSWARMVAATTVGIAGCGYLSHRAVATMRASLETESAARRAESKARRAHEASQRDREKILQHSMASQKLESVGRLAGGVAHDFNNALMIIRGGVDILRAAPHLTAEDREVLADLSGAVDAAAATSRQLLAFGAARPEDAGTCTPESVLERFGASVQRLLPETIRIKVATEPTPDIPLHAPALEQVLLNLVINARDALPQGGVVTLGCRVDRDTHQVTIEVADDGVGMTESVRSQIFEPFFTTKKDRGTGLGLAMVWGVVTHAGGSIDVVSAPNQGARFVIRFRPVEKRPQVAAPVRPRTATPNGRLRILVLEDQPEVLRTLLRMLKGAGFDVTGCDRARTAMQELAAANYDVLVTDVVVPEGGVAELIDDFRRRHPKSPVLVCSGHVDEELVSIGIKAGEYQLLRKPFSAEELLHAIRALTRSAA